MSDDQQIYVAVSLLGFLGILATCALISAMFVVGFLNAAMGCDRDHTENCIVVQHVWEAGL